MRAFGFKHELVDTYSSLQFSGGSVTLAGLPAVGSVYTISALVRPFIGATGNVLVNGSSTFSIDSTGHLKIGANISTGTVRDRGWCQVAAVCDGVNTYFYCDGELIGQASSGAVAFAGGAGSVALMALANICDLCIAPTAFTQAQVRQLFYTSQRSGLSCRFAMDEGLGTPLDSVGSATASVGANVAWSILTPKSPAMLPIDSGSLVFDGSTNAQVTIATGANGAAFERLTGGPGLTVSLWLKAHRFNAGRVPLQLVMGGATPIRTIHDPYVASQPSRFLVARPAPGIGPVDLPCTHKTQTYGQWAHMVATIDCVAGVVNTYGDGILTGQSIDASYQVGTWYSGIQYTDLRIAAQAGNVASTQWAGAVADVRFYRRALSKAEVRSLYLGKLAAEDLQFKFREGSGNATASTGSIALSAVVGSSSVWSSGSPR
jgi:hypothetical protein